MNNLQPELNTIVFGILFGFGFTIGAWIWGVIVGAVNSARGNKQP